MAKAILTKNSPFYVQFYISKHCHLKCKMCNIVEANQDLEPFSSEKIELIAANLKRIGVGVVLLTGGEPFLRKDIDQIVRIFKSKGLDVRMQTAGLIERKETIEKCVENGARDINVSLDSLDEELSDYINGVNGSWRKTLSSISFISKVFPKKHSICALGCVLSKYNIDEIEPILDFATKIGWWLSLVPVHITPPDKPMNFRGYDKYFMFSESENEKVELLINKLKVKKKNGYNLFDSDDYLNSIVHFVKTGSPSWRHNGVCDSPNLYFVILPDGSFAPCCDYRFPEKIYLYDDNFPSIYNSDKFRASVKSITSNCSGCNFGSFPEMTLSARSFSTIAERLKLQFKAGKRSIFPIEEKALYEIIEEIKQNYPVYSENKFYQKRGNKFIL
jgi:MoaA/NifB/PqqE/SkfB family radical SAM enzyme